MAHRMDIAIRHGNCETAQVGQGATVRKTSALWEAQGVLSSGFCIGLIAARQAAHATLAPDRRRADVKRSHQPGRLKSACYGRSVSDPEQ